MVRRMGILLIVLAIILFIVMSPIGVGQGSTAIIRISAPTDVWLSVNGEKYLLSTGRDVEVTLGSEVCLLNTTVYESYDLRDSFSYWIVNGTIYSSNNCITINKPGVYRAYFIKEYMVQIISSPLVYTSTLWVREGNTIKYTIPLVINETNVLYKFSHWNLGENPLNNTILVTVTKPLVITAYYDTYYPVRISKGNSSILLGWFKQGTLYYYMARPLIVLDNGTRYVLENVYAIGSTIVSTLQNVFTIRIDGPTTIYPVYRREYLVNISLPTGNTTVWVQEGDSYPLKAPSTIQVNDTVKLVFSHWGGDINASSPTFIVKVTKPLNVRAYYTTLYRVEIVSPLGTETRWVSKGGRLAIYQPPELPGVLTSRVLDSFIVEGQFYKPKIPGILIIEHVDKPIGVLVVYKTRILWLNIAVFFGFIVLIISAYLIYILIKTSGIKLFAKGKKQ